MPQRIDDYRGSENRGFMFHSLREAYGPMNEAVGEVGALCDGFFDLQLRFQSLTTFLRRIFLKRDLKFHNYKIWFIQGLKMNDLNLLNYT